MTPGYSSSRGDRISLSEAQKKTNLRQAGWLSSWQSGRRLISQIALPTIRSSEFAARCPGMHLVGQVDTGPSIPVTCGAGRHPITADLHVPRQCLPKQNRLVANDNKVTRNRGLWDGNGVPCGRNRGQGSDSDDLPPCDQRTVRHSRIV